MFRFLLHDDHFTITPLLFFQEYLHKAGDPKWIEDIHKDLHRQFPLHEIFALRGGHG